MFDGLPKFTPDAILALIDQFAADRREQKIDLGVGVYKTNDGRTPVMKCVKTAEDYLLSGQSTKTYLGSSGNKEFTAEIKKLVLGAELHDRIAAQTVAFQSLGGTGALSLAADLIAKASAESTVWVGTPTWPNHFALFQRSGLAVEKYVYCEPLQQEVDFASLMDAAARAKPGDTFLIHACCHNPTGIDLDAAQADALLSVLKERQVFPLVDCAYAGFGDGFEEDLSLARKVLDRFDEAIVCFSCSKNFGIYRERVGAILVKSKQAEATGNIVLGLSSLARATYSMPADHGAAVVVEILKSPELRALWQEELNQIRSAIVRKRVRLSEYKTNTGVLGALKFQHGMFSLLPIDASLCAKLRDDFGIYMTGNARINVVGVSDEMESYFVESIARALGQSSQS
jgi:aromatic-amino-acid transaminase